MSCIDQFPIGRGFIAGTLVETESGPKPIEQLKVGERILTIDPHSRQREYAPLLNILKLEAEPISAVKYTDSDPNSSNLDEQVFHIYTTTNQVFFVPETGWVDIKQLKSDQDIMVLYARYGQQLQTWPVLRTPFQECGWVSTDFLYQQYSLEAIGHLVDFRNGCNLWQYSLRGEKSNPLGVPTFYGNYFSHPLASSDCGDLERILKSNQPFFEADAYELYVGGFQTYCVGTLGVVVQGRPMQQDDSFSTSKFKCDVLLENSRKLEAASNLEAALTAARKAESIANDAQTGDLLAKSQLRVAEILIVQQQPDAARSLLFVVLTDARQRKDLEAEGQALFLQASINAHQGDMQACLDKSNAALALGPHGCGQVTFDHSLLLRARTFFKLDMLDRALADFEMAYRSVATYSPGQGALILSESGRVLALLDRQTEAEAAFDLALTQASEMPAIAAAICYLKAETFSQHSAQSSLMDAASAFCKAQEGKNFILVSRAKQLIEQIAPQVRIESATLPSESPHIKAAHKAYANCDYALALKSFTEAKALAENCGDSQLKAHAAIGISNCLRRQGFNSEALLVAEDGVKAAENAQSLSLLAYAQLTMGSASLNSENLVSAEQLFNAALENGRTAGNQSLIAEVLLLLSECRVLQREYEQAWIMNTQALNEAIEAVHAEAIVMIATRRSEMLRTSYELDEALDIADFACSLTIVIDSPRTSANARHIRGLVLKAQNNFGAAAAEFGLALEYAHKVGEQGLIQRIENDIQSTREVLKHWPVGTSIS